MGLPGHRALLKVHLRLAPVDNCGGVKKRIFNPGASWRARDRARREGASATEFFFPWIKEASRAILYSPRLFTDDKAMGLDQELDLRELKLLKAVLESD